MSVVISVFLLAIGIVVLVDILTNSANRPPLFLLLWVGGVAAQGWWVIFRVPQRIEVLAEGLRFVARTRTVVIPWNSLRSVSAPRFDPNRQRLKWEADGQTVRTWASYDGFHRLLQLVEQRAPEAEIRNL